MQDFSRWRIFELLNSYDRDEFYPLAIRRKAARLVLEIAFLVYLNQFHTLAELSRYLAIRGVCDSTNGPVFRTLYAYHPCLKLLKRILGIDGTPYYGLATFQLSAESATYFLSIVTVLGKTRVLARQRLARQRLPPQLHIPPCLAFQHLASFRKLVPQQRPWEASADREYWKLVRAGYCHESR
jgi:hypothetical protein